MGKFDGIKNLFLQDDYDDYYDDDIDEEEDIKPIKKHNENNDRNFNSSKQTFGMQSKVTVAKPTVFGDVSDIGKNINQQKLVLLNLEDSDSSLSRRIVDFISGVAFANDATIQKVATNMFMIVPQNVVTENNFIDLDGSMDNDFEL